MLEPCFIIQSVFSLTEFIGIAREIPDEGTSIWVGGMVTLLFSSSSYILTDPIIEGSESLAETRPITFPLVFKTGPPLFPGLTLTLIWMVLSSLIPLTIPQETA